MRRLTCFTILLCGWLTASAAQPPDPHAGHAMSASPAPDAPASSPGASDHNAAHDMSSMPAMAGKAEGVERPAFDVPDKPPPPSPRDHLADRLYDAKRMESARALLRSEHGGSRVSLFLLDQAEYRAAEGGGYAWDAEAWYGGDINRVVVKSEGDGSRREGATQVEAQAAYSHAISPFFNVQAGVRHDFRPSPTRTFATVGIEGIAPYWFRIDVAAYVSNAGEVLGRFKWQYDLRLTQRLILQPEMELNLSAQSSRELRLGTGLTDIDAGLRLRYEIRREFAPYLGISWERPLGSTSELRRATGQQVQNGGLVLGVRAWF